METIAEINDLACRSIESGDYHIALSALNSALECVKQLKGFRRPVSEQRRNTRVKKDVTRMLKVTKQKLMTRSQGTPNSSFVTTRPRKRPRRQTPYDDREFYSAHDKNPNLKMEDKHFIYCKPIRLSKFQLERVSECSSKSHGGSNVEHQDILREVELGISSSLIFNIALSHQLIANEEVLSRNPRYNQSLPPVDGSLQTKERLNGALRLYELGFRVHTKRMAVVMSPRTQSSQRTYTPSTVSIPSISSLSSFASTTVSSLSQEEAQSFHLDSREDELKCSTRFSLALLNNCAQIHETLGQVDKAKLFQNRLLSFLMVIVDSGESIHEIIGDDPAVEGYLNNALTKKIFDKKTAPAAMA